MVKFLEACAIDIVVGGIIFGEPFLELVFMPPLTIMYFMIIFLWILAGSFKGIRSTLLIIGVVYVAGTMFYLFNETFRDFFNHILGITYSCRRSEFNPSTIKCVIYGLISWWLIWWFCLKGNDDDDKKSTDEDKEV